MQVSFHPDARLELLEAAQDYNARLFGLGEIFLEEIEKTVRKLCEAPSRPPVDLLQRRKWRLRRFPYSVIYKIDGGRVIILAVAHASRRPGYWDTRTPEGFEERAAAT